MRRIIAFDRVSADGYFAAPDGDLSWAMPDEEHDRGVAEHTSADPTGGTMLLGRRTYDMFESFWPHVLDDAPDAPDPHAAGRRSPAMRAMAVWINEATKLVVSRSRPAVTWKHSRLLRGIDPAEIEALKREPGSDVMVFGSGSVVSQLTELGLVDEYQLVVTPVLLGGGRPLLEGVSRRVPLELLEAAPTRAGNVKLRYAPRR